MSTIPHINIELVPWVNGSSRLNERNMNRLNTDLALLATTVNEVIDALNVGDVRSVQVTAGAGLSSSDSTVQHGAVSTQISVAEGYKLPTEEEWEAMETEPIPVSEVEEILQYGADIDPILENNSWETIKAVCDAGEAGDYWSVGDTKTDVGSDGVTRTFRICDMQGLYGKHLVFEQMEIEATTSIWNSSTNPDLYNAINVYTIATINQSTLNSTVLGRYSSDLRNAITRTNTPVAQNGTKTSVPSASGFLFLPATKEIYGANTEATTQESAALTQYQWYTQHTSTADRKKKKGDEYAAWWLRSPANGTTTNACLVAADGSLDTDAVTNQNGVAPCFAM